MEYRLNKTAMLETLEQWNGFLKRKVHLIACGGTALTLLDVKPSTKDVDMLVPIVSEYNYLLNILKDMGYKRTTASGWKKENEVFMFDLFPDKRIHTTELLDSPIEKENHIFLKEYSYLYIGILNPYDLIASKLVRGTKVDYDDCLMLIKAQRNEIDIKRMKEHVKELARYDISEQRIKENLEVFLLILTKEELYD